MRNRMKHIVMWSGGITSYATARHVIAEHGTASTTLLFADTLIEDEDLYTFNEQASAQLGVPITRVADGRTPWQVFEDKRWMGNTRTAQCSRDLKQVPCRRWLEANADPADTTVYVGMDWSEPHRIPGVRSGYAHPMEGCERTGSDDNRISPCAGLFTEHGRLPGPGCARLLPPERSWQVDVPLARPPYQDKRKLIREARLAGLPVPQMYDLGFAHANCGGACVKGGQAQWARLLEVFPDRYAKAEAAEAKMRALLGKDVSILRDRTGGTTKPLTLTALRTRIEAARRRQPDLLEFIDENDWGGCGCFTELTPAA